VNRQIRRVAATVGVLLLALLINLNYVQVVKSNAYRNDPDNRRVLLNEYSNPRGQIVVDGAPIAESVPTKDELKYQRKYPQGPVYAPLTGYYSFIYGADALEQTENEWLSGTDDRLLTNRFTDLLTGRNPTGGSVTLTINDAAQQAAYQALAGRRGAVVAIDPSTGAILAAATSPSYDPNTLSGHNADSAGTAWAKLTKDDNAPMLNRAFQASYPPGSIFKVVVAAAALKAGIKPTDQVPAPTVLDLPDGGTMTNFNGEKCGNGKTDSMDSALTTSCNTAFANIGIQLGEQALTEEAAAFGIDNQPWHVPLAVGRSTVGDIPDDSALGQASIGQRSVQLTPLQAAMIAAAVENNGVLMRPYLVAQLQAPNLSVLSRAQPQELSTVLTRGQDEQLKAMMEHVVTSGTGTKAAIAGYTVGGKTGTADNGPVDAQGNFELAPHAWFIGFATDTAHPIAVAVVLENAGVTGSESAGGEAAAPVAATVMQAYLNDTK